MTHAFHADHPLAPVATPNGSSNRSPSGSAQDRLLDCVTRLAAHGGYTKLIVERILATAGVSRATFYQYFSNVDDCFWTAYRHHADDLVSGVVAASQGSERPERAVLDALLATAPFTLMLMGHTHEYRRVGDRRVISGMASSPPMIGMARSISTRSG